MLEFPAPHAWMTIAFTTQDYHTVTIREADKETQITRGLSVYQNSQWWKSCLRLWGRGLCYPWFHRDGTTFFFVDGIVPPEFPATF